MLYTEQQIKDAIMDTYTFLETNFDALYAKCNTPQQQSDFRHSYVAARDAYWAAINKSLTDNNPMVDQTTSSLILTNTNLKNALTSIQNMVEFINLCTSAVQLAASLATLAAAIA
jgi:hypothetical protein